ncbi:hypothetical protein [Archangium sp.]|uniref:hypothetical protein n=1 Tax=Archangium sp. TaxID=1872627 RepID=UPI002D31BB0B|nr:hypothetical protein [Archangium sp.]HYO52200.1 hypothetical protein [Archangium sp.]
MENPVPEKPRMAPWKKVGLVAAVLAVACLMAVAGGAFSFIRHGGGVADQALSNEARVNVLRLCGDVQSYRDEHGVFPAAGPVPKEVPRGGGAVPFEPDENLKKVGFNPGERVRYQYQVVVQETPLGEAEVTCYARGDLDGDGQVSVFSVTLDANGMTSPVKVEREEE